MTAPKETKAHETHATHTHESAAHKAMTAKETKAAAPPPAVDPLDTRGMTLSATKDHPAYFGVPSSSPPPVKSEAAGKGAFRVGSRVRFESGAVCTVQAVKDDDLYSLVTEDAKHAFDAQGSQLKALPAK